MGRRSSEEQPAVRKSFLVMGGIAVGVAVLAFVATNVLMNRPPADDQASAISETVGSPAPTSTPDSAEITDAPGTRSEGLVPGGRDPFTPAVVSSGEGAQVAGTVVENTDVVVTVFSVYGGGADVQVGEDVFEGAKPGDRLSSGVLMKGIDDKGCVSFDREGDSFTVCKGQRATH
jgi:hypothetical protein